MTPSIAENEVINVPVPTPVPRPILLTSYFLPTPEHVLSVPDSSTISPPSPPTCMCISGVRSNTAQSTNGYPSTVLCQDDNALYCITETNPQQDDHDPQYLPPHDQFISHHPTMLPQLDGNFSLSFDQESDDQENDDQENDDQENDDQESDDNDRVASPDHQIPQPHSTPTQDHPVLDDLTPNDLSPIIIPGLLDNSDPSLSSISLESHPDLDNFLPFAVNDDQTDHEPDHLLADLSPGREPSPAPDTLPTSPQAIPVVVNNTNHHQQSNPPRTPCRQTIRRDNRAVTALSLPNIMVTNHRSIFPKFNNLVDEILENEMHLGLHSEIWEDKEKVAHAKSIEEALEIHGIQYISTPRPNRRGGGAAITLISESPFLLTKLDIPVESGGQSLEVCWGLLKPKNPTGHIKCLIVCAFYLPPYSRKKTALVEHITLNYFSLKSQHPESAFVCGGDKNDLNIQLLLNIDPSFRQIITKPTYKQSVLDVLVTDIGQYYMESIIRPAVQPDNPATASPSDHRIGFAKTNTSASQPVKRESKTHTVRPLPDDAIVGFAGWVQHESWEFIYNGLDPSDMVSRFDFLINLNLDHYCPTKVIKNFKFRWENKLY